MAELVTRLIPILRVGDPRAERSFYELFGLRTTYEGPEYPDFIAVGNDCVEFGLSGQGAVTPQPGSLLQWQLGVSDAAEVVAACDRAGLAYRVEADQPAGGWRYRIVKVISPNGVEVWFEEEAA